MNNDKKKIVIAISGVIITITIIVILIIIGNKGKNVTSNLGDDINNEINNYNGKVISCQNPKNKHENYVIFIDEKEDTITRIITESTVGLGIFGNYNDNRYLSEDEKAKIRKEYFYQLGLKNENIEGIKITIDYPADMYYAISTKIDIDYSVADTTYLDKLYLNFKGEKNVSSKLKNLFEEKDYDCDYAK